MHTDITSRNKSAVDWRRLIGLFALLAVLATACGSEPTSSAADSEPSEAATTDDTTAETPAEEAPPTNDSQLDDVEAEEERDEADTANDPVETHAGDSDETDTGDDPAETETADEGSHAETDEADENPEALALTDEDSVDQAEPGFSVGCVSFDWVSTGTDEDGDGVNDFTLAPGQPGGFSASTEPSDLGSVAYTWEFTDLSGSSASETVPGPSEIVSSPPAGDWMVTVIAEANGETSSATCEGSFIVRP